VKKTMLALPVAVLFAVTVGACGSTSHSSADKGSATETTVASSVIPADAAFNAADVAFAQEMIPHHAQAVDMAGTAVSQATSAQVKVLALQIKAAQDPEIATMTGWLTTWGQKVPDTSMGTGSGMDMGGMPKGEGMMSDSDMTRLSAATGPAFDQFFLEMMVRHHTGAVKMAQQELADGKYEPAKQLAQTIITGQQAEIAEMNQMMASLPKA
jgi:uncharacterized protein (DUF305 family)